MRIEIIGDGQIPEWERFVESHPHTLAWHSCVFKPILEKHYPVTFHPIAAFEGSDIVGILPLYTTKTALSGKKLISVPYFVAGGIVASDTDVRLALLDRAIELSKENGGCQIVLKQYKHAMPGELTTDAHFYNRELDITRDLQVIRGEFDKRNLESLDVAAPMNFSLEYPVTDTAAFYRLLSRHNRNKGVPGISRRWVDDIVALGMYKIAFLHLKGKVVAATMVKEFKKTISFPHTCTHRLDCTHILYVYELYWRLIQYYAANGFEIFHSGRIPETNDTEIYRLGWGGVRHQYHYQYYPKTVTDTEYSNKRGWKREIFKTVWRLTPQPIVDAAGPKIYDLFP